MAFVRVDEWSLADKGASDILGQASNRSIMDAFIYAIGGTKTRAVLASLATIAVHVALLLFILLRLSSVEGKAGATASAAMSFIDLSSSSSATPQRAPAQPQAASQTDQLSMEAVKSPLTATIVPEWVMVKLRVAHVEQPSPAPSAAQPPAAPAPTMAANNGGNGGGYDPYAGSAPRWRDQPPVWRPPTRAALPSTMSQPATLDPATTKRIRKILAKAGVAGDVPIRLRFEVNQDERITAMIFLNPILDHQRQNFIFGMLRGRKLACIVNASNCATKMNFGTTVEVIA